ncbi:MAG: hypothetical protein M3R09_02510 [Actinomycetota bacterium]|jgi:hypothetical protein|nr:hypothetical protein [Actinomycetota bacterium]
MTDQTITDARSDALRWQAVNSTTSATELFGSARAVNTLVTAEFGMCSA